MTDAANIQKMEAVVDYVITYGTQNTSWGNWVTDFLDIPEEVADHDFIKANADEICDMLAVRDEVLDIAMNGDNFDVVYGLAYCPNLQEEEDIALYEEAQVENKIDQFWSIIDTAREESGGWNKMLFSLQDALAELEPPDIVQWYSIYDQYYSHADKEKIVSAATYINNGISDDGFIDFRSWLIAQGKDVYMNTLADPDSLANTESVKAFFAEVNSSEFEPSKGYQNRPQFEQFSYAAAVAHEMRLGEDGDFYDLFNKNPLPATIVAAIENEVKYADDIDAAHNQNKPWLETLEDLGKMFPKLQSAMHQSEMSAVQPTIKDSEVYELSFSDAQQKGETDQYHQSNKHNRSCMKAIDTAISESQYEQYHYNFPKAAQSVIAEYGESRVSWVLANVLQNHSYDGRYSNANKNWAKTFDVPENKRDYYLNSHAILVDGFVDAVRKEIERTTDEKLVDPSIGKPRSENSGSQSKDSKPSILSQLQEGKKAVSQAKEQPKSAPKRNNDMEV